MSSAEGHGQLFVIAAPSGAGKTSLVAALMARQPALELSISHTTRPARPGETDGTHYHFVEADRFEADIQAGAFLEHARVFDHYYGTRRQTVADALAAGRELILEIDWQGARQVREQFPDCVSIFIAPPSLETLRERLNRRGQDSEAVIRRRMADAQRELSHYREFAYLVVNEDFDTAVDELETIVLADRRKLVRQPPERIAAMEGLLNNR